MAVPDVSAAAEGEARPWLAANQAAAKRCCRLAISTNLESWASSRLRLPSSVMSIDVPFSPEESDRRGVLSLPVLLGVSVWTCRFRCLGVPGVMLAARMDAAALDAFMLLVLVDPEETASSVLAPLPFLFQSARRVDSAGLGRGLGHRTRSRL